MKTVALGLMAGLMTATMSHAATFTESFEDAFPAWESRFMGTESNLTNFFEENGGSNATNNSGPALWFADGDGVLGSDTVEILFNSAFAAQITSLSFKMSTYAPGITVEIYDGLGATLLSSAVAADSQAIPTQMFGATSANGISGFSVFTNFSQIEGNSRIDDIVVNTAAAPVPLPASAVLLIAGLAGMGAMTRRRARKS